VWGAVVAIAGLVCAIALRIMMYTMGETLFMLY
jgi:anaerobic dimethyl sulfoxide reductase subunit C (anchor subunit)